MKKAIKTAAIRKDAEKSKEHNVKPKLDGISLINYKLCPRVYAHPAGTQTRINLPSHQSSKQTKKDAGCDAGKISAGNSDADKDANADQDTKHNPQQ
jgi:hypothetical protein